MAISVGRRPSSAFPKLLFLSPIEAELQLVEEYLSNELFSAVRTVASVSYHVLEAGGKRLRPSLLLLSALACQRDWDTVPMCRVAASTEMLHMATLIHDDVIDGANSRRGRATANSIWGNQVSVLAGDYILAKTFSILARHGDSALMLALSRVAVSMTEGEVSQIESRGDTGALTGIYLSNIHDKTASFISVCCRMGAMMAGGTPGQIESLASYGTSLGMAFQITDDLLDIAGDPIVTGKPVGGDIREGKITMPLLLTLERAGREDRDRLESIIHGSTVTSEDIEFARILAEDTGAIERTRDAAAEYIRQAIRNLSELPFSRARNSLEELAEFVTLRKA